MNEMSTNAVDRIEHSGPVEQLVISEPKSGSYVVSPGMNSVSFGFDQSMIVKTVRDGDSLILTLSNGEVIEVINYFSTGTAAGYLGFGNGDAVSLLTASFILKESLFGGGDGNGTVPDTVFVNSAEFANGRMVVRGIAPPMANVEVTFPDGERVLTTAMPGSGVFEATSTRPQGDGMVYINVMDNGGEVTASTELSFVASIDPLTFNSSDGSNASGSGEPGASIVIENADGLEIGSTQVDQDGNWTVALSPPPADGSLISALQTVPNGGTFGPLFSTVDYIPGAPPAPVADPSDGSIVSGTGEPGAVVTVADGSGTPIGTATVAPDGSWAIALSPSAADGSALRVFQTDPAGNESDDVTVTVDTTLNTAPDAPGFDPSDGTTASGTGEPAATVEVTDAAGTVLGTAIVQPDGGWSMSLSPSPADGSAITATQSDPDGNESPGTTGVVDYTPGAPSAPIFDPTDGTSVTGSGEAGATVEVTNASGTLIGTAVVQPSGSWGTSLSPIPGDGETLTAIQTDPSGKDSPASTRVVDTGLLVAPDPLVFGPSDGTSASGFGEPGAVVEVVNSAGVEIGSATVQPDGSWATPLSPTPGDGTQITAQQVLVDGQEGDPVSQIVDYTPGTPNAPGLDPSDGLIASGTGEPGATTTVTDDAGNVIGTATVAPDGSWSTALSPTPADGSVIQATQTDPAGNESAPATETIDNLPGAPDEPIINPTNGSSAFGRGEPGAMVYVRDASDTEIGTSMVRPDGNWATALSPVPGDGTVITATQMDPAGNESGPASETVDASALIPPFIDPSVGLSASGTGEAGAVVSVTDENGDPIGTATVQPDGSWSTALSPMPDDGSTITAIQTDPGGNASPPATQTIDYVAGAPVQPGLDPSDGGTASGTGEPGATVEVTDDANTVIGTATVFPDGSWSTALSPTPADGSDISATQTDPAGNESPPAVTTVDYISGAPAAPTINPSDGSMAFGSGEAGSVVTVTNAANTTIGTATVQPDGSWVTFLSPTPADGSDIDAFQTDVSGNDSPSVSTTIDYTPGTPAAPGLDPSDGSTASGTGEPGATVEVTNDSAVVIGTATVQPNGSWSTALSPIPGDGSDIDANQTDPAGNQSPSASVTVDYAANTLPTPGLDPSDGSSASGTGQPGATVEIRDAGNALIGTATVQPDGSWNTALSPIPADGSDISAQQTDPGSNDSALATTTVDYTPGTPAIPGLDPSDGLTASGTGEPGATVEVTDESNAVIGTATVQPDGSWSTALSPRPADGSEIEASQTDPAGNESPPASETIDYVPGAPGAPVIDPSVGLSASGTGEAGAVVSVTDENGDPIGTATVQPDGSWSTALSPMPDDGSTITAIQTDPGGNASPPATQSVSNGVGSGGSPAQVNTDTTGYQSPPKTLVLDDGRVLYVWGNDGSTSYDPDMILQGRIYNADGSASTGQFALSTIWKYDNIPHYDWDSLDVDLLQNGNVLLSYARNLSESGDNEPVFSIIDPAVTPGNPGFVVVANVEAQSSDTTTYESAPVSTVLANGNILMVWVKNANNDDATMAVRARMFDENGAPLGNEYSIGSFAIDGYNLYDVDNMVVTQLTGGNIVVSYVRQTSEAGGHDEPIFSILNASGTVLLSDTEIQQNDTTIYESPAAITAMADGRWAAVWIKNGNLDDNAQMTLQGRIMEADGTPSTDEFQVGSFAVDGFQSYDRDHFSIRELSDGKLVVGLVRSTIEPGADRPVFNIIDPSFAPNQVGFEVASDVVIAQTANNTYAGPPVIETIGNGNFVAVWGDGWYNDQGIYYRIYNSNGAPLTDQILVVGETNLALESFNNFGWDNLEVSYNASNHSFVINWVNALDGSYSGVATSGPIPAPGQAPTPVPGNAPAEIALASPAEATDAPLSFAGLEGFVDDRTIEDDFTIFATEQIDLSLLNDHSTPDIDFGSDPQTDSVAPTRTENVESTDISVTAAVLEEANSEMAMLAAHDQVSM